MKLTLNPAQRTPKEITERHWSSVIERTSGRTVAISSSAARATRIQALPAAPMEAIIGTERASLSWTHEIDSSVIDYGGRRRANAGAHADEGHAYLRAPAAARATASVRSRRVGDKT